MRTGVLVVDAENRIKLANEAASLLIGDGSEGEHDSKGIQLPQVAPELARRLQQWRNGWANDEAPLQLSPDQPEIQPRFARLLVGSDLSLSPPVQEAAQGLLFVESSFSRITDPAETSVNFSCKLISELPANAPPHIRAPVLTIRRLVTLALTSRAPAYFSPGVSRTAEAKIFLAMTASRALFSHSATAPG